MLFDFDDLVLAGSGPLFDFDNAQSGVGAGSAPAAATARRRRRASFWRRAKRRR
ncbi:MAG: hypothetical protein IT356_12485 [Gemmatimonadaceae bacterium]|nr:hypothetical protein [Gemmatimonadaceae bacterium]